MNSQFDCFQSLSILPTSNIFVIGNVSLPSTYDTILSQSGATKSINDAKSFADSFTVVAAYGRLAYIMLNIYLVIANLHIYWIKVLIAMSSIGKNLMPNIAYNSQCKLFDINRLSKKE